MELKLGVISRASLAVCNYLSRSAASASAVHYLPKVRDCGTDSEKAIAAAALPVECQTPLFRRGGSRSLARYCNILESAEIFDLFNFSGLKVGGG